MISMHNVTIRAFPITYEFTTLKNMKENYFCHVSQTWLLPA